MLSLGFVLFIALPAALKKIPLTGRQRKLAFLEKNKDEIYTDPENNLVDLHTLDYVIKKPALKASILNNPENWYNADFFRHDNIKNPLFVNLDIKKLFAEGVPPP